MKAVSSAMSCDSPCPYLVKHLNTDKFEADSVKEILNDSAHKESRVVSHDLKNLEHRSAEFLRKQDSKYFRLLGPQVSVISPFCCCSPEAARNNI